MGRLAKGELSKGQTMRESKPNTIKLFLLALPCNIQTEK
jgi:hypothetical protein